MSDLVAMLRSAHENPLATEYDHRQLLLLAANAIDAQKITIKNLIIELARAKK